MLRTFLVKFWKSFVPVDWPLLKGDVPYQMLSSWCTGHWLPEEEQGENAPTLQFRKGRKALKGIRYKTKH